MFQRCKNGFAGIPHTWVQAGATVGLARQGNVLARVQTIPSNLIKLGDENPIPNEGTYRVCLDDDDGGHVVVYILYLQATHSAPVPNRLQSRPSPPHTYSSAARGE